MKNMLIQHHWAARPIIWTMAVLITVLSASGCAQQTAAPATAPIAKPVEGLTLKKQSLPDELTYTGVVGSEKILKLSFKMPGKIAAIYVKKGDPIRNGQKLAELSKTDLTFAEEAAGASLDKAKLAYDDAQRTYANVKSLYEGGVAAKNDLDKAKLDMDVKEATYKQAMVDYASKQSTMNDSELFANMDGYVVDVLNKEGEIVAAGYPVVVLRNGDEVVNVGLSAEDVPKVHELTKAKVLLNGRTLDGSVHSIDQVPDPQSRTYNTEIVLDQPVAADAFRLGATAQVLLQTGQVQGIWIPIASVLNDGEDYVYIAQDGRAVKRNVRILSHQGFNVRVDGVKTGEELVTAGMKELQEGSPVSVQQGAGGK